MKTGLTTITRWKFSKQKEENSRQKDKKYIKNIYKYIKIYIKNSPQKTKKNRKNAEKKN